MLFFGDDFCCSLDLVADVLEEEEEEEEEVSDFFGIGLVSEEGDDDLGLLLEVDLLRSFVLSFISSIAICLLAPTTSL